MSIYYHTYFFFSIFAPTSDSLVVTFLIEIVFFLRKNVDRLRWIHRCLDPLRKWHAWTILKFGYIIFRTCTKNMTNGNSVRPQSLTKTNEEKRKKKIKFFSKMYLIYRICHSGSKILLWRVHVIFPCGLWVAEANVPKLSFIPSFLSLSFSIFNSFW